MISPASPADATRLERGRKELIRLGYSPLPTLPVSAPRDYFAASADERRAALVEAMQDERTAAVFCARGGYGSNYLLEVLTPKLRACPKILLGYSDVTSLQLFLWQKLGWVTFYGPMVAAGFEGGPDAPGGYDSKSLQRALTEASNGWALDLQGETLSAGVAEGALLGGCLTLVETALGTPWELNTAGSILLLEDCAMKPYQVDRALMHLKQAGKLQGVRGILLGEFPESAPPEDSRSTVREICARILEELRVPIVWGIPAGHTRRPMLTLPLGVRVRLRGSGAGQLEILEPAVAA